MTRHLAGWVGCALVSMAPALLLGRMAAPAFWEGTVLLTLGLGLLAAAPLRADAGTDARRRWLRRALAALTVSSLAFAAHLVLEPVLLRQPRFPWFTDVSAVLAGLVRDVAVTVDGDLALRSPEGVLLFAPTAEKIGLIPFASFVTAGVVLRLLEPRGKAQGIAVLLGCGLAAMIFRYAFNLLRFAHLDDVLSGSGPAKTELFQRPGETLAWIVGLGILVALLSARSIRSEETGDTPPSPARPIGRRRTVAAVLNVSFGVLVLVFWIVHAPPGVAKAGRLLVDDTFSKGWEPAARRLTTEWFGDFSTYSFSSAVEWLGYHFATTVNTSERYTDALLAQYDVLVLKTPSRDIPQEDEAAIRRFVQRGGGLLVVSDHTDLMGMSSRLNRLSELAGIRFRSDSVMDAPTGSFSYYVKPALGAHPAARRVRHLEFMTSCSISLKGSAEPVLVVPHQIRQKHDYSNNSYFGQLRSDPQMDHGPLILAAAGTYGQGRVLAFSDSTVLSSFALFEFDREQFLLDAVAFLNTRYVQGGLLRWGMLACGLSCLAVGLYLLRGCSAELGLAAVLVALAGGVAGMFLADRAADLTYPAPEPVRPVPRVSIWLPDTEARFPAVLGNIAERELDDCYDTFLAAVPRSGVMPKLADRLEDALAEKAMFVLNPTRGIDTRSHKRLQQWMQDGGRLVLATKNNHVHMDALRSYLPFGMDFQLDDRGRWRVLGMQPQASPSPHLRLFSAAVGSGKIIFVAGAQWWSRDRLGHAFHIPGAETRACYSTLATVLEEHAGLAPAHRRTYRILESAFGAESHE